MRAAIFIDGGYIQSQFKFNNIKPDYEELADYFLEPLRQQVPLDLLRCYYYYCAPYMSAEPTDSEIKRMEGHNEFVDEIESLDRWSMRLGKLEKRWDGKKEYFEQKRVDVLLSVDLVRHSAAGHIQHAVLVAGDSDFVPAVEAAKEHGVTVSLWCGNFRTVHKDLIALADEVHTLYWPDFPKRVTAEDRAAKKTSQQNQGKNPNQSGRRHGPKNTQGKPNKNRQPRRHEKKAAKAEFKSSGDKSSWTERIRKWWE